MKCVLYDGSIRVIIYTLTFSKVFVGKMFNYFGGFTTEISKSLGVLIKRNCSLGGTKF